MSAHHEKAGRRANGHGNGHKHIRGCAGPRSFSEVRSTGGVVSGGHPAEAEAGARLLASGGNAVDAAVAAAFAGFVVEPIDCGLGGFARVSAWLPRAGSFLSVDGYVRAPGRAHERMFTPATANDTYYGHPPTVGDAARYGGLAVAVPGAVAGLYQAHEEGGRRPWAEVLEPAIELAERGVPFTWRDQLTIAKLGPVLDKLPAASGALRPHGRLPHAPVQLPDGERLDTRALARTLRSIAEGGPGAFYTGPMADHIARAVARDGGVLEASDLEGYRPRLLDERPHRYRRFAYVTCDDPVGYEALGVLEQLPLGALDEPTRRHLVAEALGLAFTDALTWDGDPAFMPDDAPLHLRTPAFAEARARALRSDAVLGRPLAPATAAELGLGPDVSSPVGRAVAAQGTSQMVACDDEGGVAAICTAVGWDFGSLVYVDEGGFFLNNGMSFFDPRPGRRTSIQPGKQPLFGAPVIAAVDEDGWGFAAAGSGGYRIATAVVHALHHVADLGHDLGKALNTPRVHNQGDVTFVDSRVPDRVREGLRTRGHEVVTLEEDASTWGFGRVCAVRSGPGGQSAASASPSWMTGITAVDH